nr:BRO family protein [Nostoc sp. PA-18-2419]
MTNLSVFNFESHDIRFVGTADNPWWVASDICKVLAIANVSDAVAKLDNDEKLVSLIPTSGQNREVLCINESGLYSLVLTSRKPQAKRFKKWLTSEVIPAIRKTGSYSSIAESQQSQLPAVTQSRLNELFATEASIRQQIKDIENTLRAKQSELQEVSTALVNEAKAFYSANPEVFKQAILAKEILEKAKQDNPFLSVSAIRK